MTTRHKKQIKRFLFGTTTGPAKTFGLSENKECQMSLVEEIYECSSGVLGRHI